MDYSQEDKKLIINNVLSKNGLRLIDMNHLFSKKMTDATEIRNTRSSCNIPFSKIIHFFEPNIEEVSVFDITGLEFKSGSYLGCLLDIYRPESIYKNLGDFDFDKFYKSLSTTNFLLIEKNGNYYVNGDGNHRILALMFMAYMKQAKFKKLNAPVFMQKMLHEKVKIKVPVIHLQHDDDLIMFLNDYYDSEHFGILEQDYINELTGRKNYRSITYDRISKSYSMSYKGFEYKNMSSFDTLQKMKKIESIGTSNNLYYKNGFFTLTNKHFAVSSIPKDNLYKWDELMNKITLPDTKFEYFLDTDANGKEFNLHIANCMYTDDINNMDQINRFLEQKLDVLEASEPSDVYFPSTCLYEKKYEKISFKKAITIINTLKELEDLILLNEVKQSIKK